MYVVAEINRRRTGSGPAWNALTPSPHTTAWSQNVTLSTRPRQIVGKLAATVGNQITYMLLFQSGHLIGRVGSEELRVPGERLLDRW